MHPQDQNGHQVESIGPEEEGPIPQWAPSPPGPHPSCLRSRPCSITGLAPPLPPHNPAFYLPHSPPVTRLEPHILANLICAVVILIYTHTLNNTHTYTYS